MKGREMTNTEFLLRTVRESEVMSGWQDSFSKMMDDISKDLSSKSFESGKESFEMDDAFEKQLEYVEEKGVTYGNRSSR